MSGRAAQALAEDAIRVGAPEADDRWIRQDSRQSVPVSVAEFMQEAVWG